MGQYQPQPPTKGRVVATMCAAAALVVLSTSVAAAGAAGRAAVAQERGQRGVALPRSESMEVKSRCRVRRRRTSGPSDCYSGAPVCRIAGGQRQQPQQEEGGEGKGQGTSHSCPREQRTRHSRSGGWAAVGLREVLGLRHQGGGRGGGGRRRRGGGGGGGGGGGRGAAGRGKLLAAALPVPPSQGLREEIHPPSQHMMEVLDTAEVAVEAEAEAAAVAAASAPAAKVEVNKRRWAQSQAAAGGAPNPVGLVPAHKAKPTPDAGRSKKNKSAPTPAGDTVAAATPVGDTVAAVAGGIGREDGIDGDEWDVAKSHTVFVSECDLPTAKGLFRLRAYRHEGPLRSLEPVVVYRGDLKGLENVPVRVHDQCQTSEVLGSLRCDCREQLDYALDLINENEAGGAVIYLQHEGRGIGLANKVAAYHLQDNGLDTVDANRKLGFDDDQRSYEAVKYILEDMGIESIALMTNNPYKIRCLQELGIKLGSRIPTLVASNEHNERYLRAKVQRMHHSLDDNDIDGMVHRMPKRRKSSTGRKLFSKGGGGGVSPAHQAAAATTTAAAAAAAVDEATGLAGGMAAGKGEQGEQGTLSGGGVGGVKGKSNSNKQQQAQQQGGRATKKKPSSAAAGASKEEKEEGASAPTLTGKAAVLAPEKSEAEEQYTQFGRQSVIDAIEAIGRGEMVIVVDDEDRENEGDLIFAASMATPQMLAFTIRYTSGVICVSLMEERLNELELPQMLSANQDPKNTAFTVTVDAAHGVSTGISAFDRAKTILDLASPATVSGDFCRPGHVFPLRCKPGGVLERAGHTEAALELSRLAGLPPVGALCEITDKDGLEMARLPELIEFGKEHGLVLTTIMDMRVYLREEQRERQEKGGQ